MASTRIDERIVALGLAESRSQAQRLLMAGSVRVDGQLVDKASTKVRDEQDVTVVQGSPFVSRGGEKLENALVDHGDRIAAEGFRVEGARAIDVGASTGGFTDCLLQRGAEHVVAVDVGYGQIHERLRTDPRVTNLERTNARHLAPGDLPYSPNLLVCDASFIPLATVLPATIALMDQASGWWGVLLCKPQFEAGRERMNKFGRKGVLTDVDVRTQVVEETVESVRAMGVEVLDVVQAHPPGPKGNIEYVLLVRGPV